MMWLNFHGGYFFSLSSLKISKYIEIFKENYMYIVMNPEMCPRNDG